MLSVSKHNQSVTYIKLHVAQHNHLFKFIAVADLGGLKSTGPQQA